MRTTQFQLLHIQLYVLSHSSKEFDFRAQFWFQLENIKRNWNVNQHYKRMDENHAVAVVTHVTKPKLQEDNVSKKVNAIRSYMNRARILKQKID